MFFDKEKLILEIQKQPSIWNAFSAEYKNNDTKDRAWEEISREMFPGCSDDLVLSRVSQIKKKWNNIRDCYRKFLKEQKDTSGEPTRKKKKYIFADILQFLNPMFDSKNFSSEAYFEGKENDDSSQISGDEECSTITTPPVSTRSPIMQKIRRDNQNSKSSLTSRNDKFSAYTRSSRVKRKRRHQKKNSLEKEVLEILRSRRSARKPEEDGDKSFLMSFLPDMTSLNEIQKLRFKRGMLDLILNAKYQTNNQNDSEK